MTGSPVPANSMRRLEGFCAGFSALIPLFVLATWALGRWQIGTLGPSYVPMAPSTALLFLLLAGGTILRGRWPDRPGVRWAVAGAALVAILVSLLVLAADAVPAALDMESRLTAGGATASGIPVGRMSLLTAATFLLAGLGLLLSLPPLSLLRGARTATSTISLGVAAMGLATLSGYAAGTPLLYGSGLIPMAASTALCFILLGTALLVGGDPKAWVLRALTREADAAPRPDLLLTAAALGTTAAIGVIGFLLLNGTESKARDIAGRNLAAVADAKAAAIEGWLLEHRRNAEYQFRSPFVFRRVRAYLEDPAPGDSRREAQEWLDLVREVGNYRRAALLDSSLTVRLESPQTDSPLEQEDRPLAGESLLTREVVLSDLHPCGPRGEADLDTFVPLLEPEDGKGAPGAVLVLHLDPGHHLLPLARSGPALSPSSETLLLARGEAGLRIMNSPRGAPGTDAGLSGGRAALALAAAADAGGGANMVEGIDDRGSVVFAVLRPVPGHAWFLLAKVDRDEVLSVNRSATQAILLFMVVLVAAAWLGVALLWRRREARHILGLLAAEEEGRGMAEQIEQLMRSANDIILLTDGEGRILAANDRAVEAYGRSRESLTGLGLGDLNAPGAEGTGDAFLPTGGAAAFETIHRRADGTSFPVEVRNRLVDMGGERRGFAVLRDISERRAHERALERLNRLYATLSETNQVLVRSPSLQEALRKACSVAVQIGGFTSAAILLGRAATGEPVTAARTGGPADPAESEAAEAVLRDGDRVLRAIPPAGPIPAPGVPGRVIAAFPLLGKEGPAGAFVVVAREGDSLGPDELHLLDEVASDVSFALDHFATEERRRHAEEVLRESEERFRRLTEAAPDGVVLFDDHGRITLWNGGAERMTGIPRDEAMGREFRTFLVPERHHASWEKGLRRFADTGEGDLVGRTVDIQALRRDGSEFPAEISLSATRIRGRWNAIAILRDVSERRREQERLLTLSRAVEQSPVSIVITDTAGSIRYVNPEFTRATGFAAEEALGANSRILRSGHHPPDFYASLWRTITSGRDWRGELRNKRKDGTLFWESATISPVADASGRITHYVAVKVDVTERRLLEDQFRQSQKMEAVGRLAGGVAHDFNNLLTVISGFTELTLGKLPPGDPVRPYLEEVAKASERAAGVTRQLLAFSRRQVLQTVPTDLGAVVTGLEKMLRRLIGEDVEIILRLSPDLGTVKVDPGQMEQAVVNLCVNARDAMPGGGTLVLAAENVTLDGASPRSRGGTRTGEYVALSVADTGTGMSPEVKDHVFEPFFTTKEKGKGTGLGLAQVHGIVHQSGGFIEVDSTPGAGTTIRILLPRLGAEAGVAPAPDTVPAGGRERILLVEDEPAVAEVARDSLEGAGYRVLPAFTPEALDRILAEEPEHIDLLLTDVVMPGRNGRQVADLVQARWPGVPVLYMSGYTDEVISRHGVLDPGIEFLAKPFTPASLLGKVRDVLDRRKPVPGREAGSP